MSEPQAETPYVRLPIEIQDLVADGKLSLHAGWLYGLLLAHVNYKRGDALVWPSRSNLAKRLGLRKTQSVDRYLKELADAGLIEKESRKTDRGGNESNRYTLMVVSWPRKPADPSPLHGSTPSPSEGTTLDPWTGHELDTPQLHQQEPDQRSEQSSIPTSDRFAPSGGGTKNDDFSDPWEAVNKKSYTAAGQLTRKRADDRQLFLNLIDAKQLRSNGDVFGEGVWTVDAFYDAFRRLKGDKKPIGFPGAYVEPMYAANANQGVRDWLMTLGLEPV